MLKYFFITILNFLEFCETSLATNLFERTRHSKTVKHVSSHNRMSAMHYSELVDKHSKTFFVDSPVMTASNSYCQWSVAHGILSVQLSSSLCTEEKKKAYEHRHTSKIHICGCCSQSDTQTSSSLLQWGIKHTDKTMTCSIKESNIELQ